MSLVDLFVGHALAAPPVIHPVVTGNIPTDATVAISNLYDKVFSIFTLLAGVLAVLYVIYAGIVYISSAGNAEKTKTARATLINAVIGVIVVASAYTIINLAIAIANGIPGFLSASSTGTTTGTSAGTSAGTSTGPGTGAGSSTGGSAGTLSDGSHCTTSGQCASNYCDPSGTCQTIGGVSAGGTFVGSSTGSVVATGTGGSSTGVTVATGTGGSSAGSGGTPSGGACSDDGECESGVCNEGFCD
jgi:hypothetical protein